MQTLLQQAAAVILITSHNQHIPPPQPLSQPKGFEKPRAEGRRIGLVEWVKGVD